MTAVADSLVRLGFSRYEAQAYLTLLRKSPMNGYELAKESGVPRPNIYGILERLEERGAVMRAEDARGTHFIPIASEELLARLHSEFGRTVADAKALLAETSERSPWQPVMNARGYGPAIALAQDLVRNAAQELLLAVWPQEAAALDAEVLDAEARGVRITTLCLAGCPHSCGHCHGEVHRYRVGADKSGRWLVVVPDAAEMLSAEVKEGDALAARTRQKLLVELASWYIRHTIAVASLVKDLAGREREILSPETLDLLRSIGSAEGGRDWLEHMRKIIPETAGSAPVNSSSEGNK